MFDFGEQSAALIVVQSLPLCRQLGELHIGTFSKGIPGRRRCDGGTVLGVRNRTHKKASHYN